MAAGEMFIEARRLERGNVEFNRDFRDLFFELNVGRVEPYFGATISPE
jgi:hypothetical protein